MGWVVNATPLPLYPSQRRGTHCLGGWVEPGPVWTGTENIAFAGIRSSDLPAHSESLHRLSYLGPQGRYIMLKIKLNADFLTSLLSIVWILECSHGYSILLFLVIKCREIIWLPIPVAELSEAACLLGLRVRIPLREWMFVSGVCFVLCR
jgi:hypothetical protein